MTRDEVLNMPAGDEIDVLIGVRVLGMTKEEINKRIDAGLSLSSRYISDAWEVVDKFYSAAIDKYLDGLEWRVYLVTERNGKNHDASAEAETAPLAICRAALLAVSEKESA